MRANNNKPNSLQIIHGHMGYAIEHLKSVKDEEVDRTLDKIEIAFRAAAVSFGTPDRVVEEMIKDMKEAVCLPSSERSAALDKLVKHYDDIDSRGYDELNDYTKDRLDAVIRAVKGICLVCKKEGKTMRCGACQIVRYCGTDCQKKHWAIHKYECLGRK